MDRQKLDRAIGRRSKTLRTQAGMTLNELAARSGVSRAMIGRVERAQSSATATLLGKLCAALDVSLSDVVALAEKPLWRDPESGYRRRHASPTDAASGIEIIVVDLPAGARVPYSPWGRNAFTQQLLMLEGAIVVHIDAQSGACVTATVSTST
jgi:transcriptional regulator with XRE-family HTH domain